MKKIIDALVTFRDDRDWKQFHTPENLAKSIAIEAAELLENFQWGESSNNQQNIQEELADIMSYCLLLCEHYNLNPSTIIQEKIRVNEKKYPVDVVKGKSFKYTTYKK